MRKITLGRTNESVSAISLGTWSFGGANKVGNIPVGWAGQSDKDSTAALLRAWESNINHWDTADVYGEGKSEKIIGKIWGQVPRDKIVLATKVGWDKGSYSNWYNPQQMKHNMDRSLINLKSDYVDIMYLHHCNFGKNNELFDDAFATIKQFQQEGKTRFVGLSDWSSERILKFIDKCDPDVVQTYRNIMDDKYTSSGLKKYIDQNNIGACFFSPIKHGLLTGKYNEPAFFGIGDHRSGIKQFADQSVILKLQKNKNILEKKYRQKDHPVMYRVVNALFNDCPTSCVVLGQRNPKQVEAASSLGDVLSKDESEWVKSLYSL